MGKSVRSAAAAGLFLLGAAGCSTVGETLGISAPTNPLSPAAKAVRETAPARPRPRGNSPSSPSPRTSSSRATCSSSSRSSSTPRSA